MDNFTPHHMNATAQDLAGNNGIGRYILLPGSDGRAKEISQHFNDLIIKMHPRGHNLYLGTIEDNGKKIDVATIASGMGCPSMEIILHELFHLGAKRFLRVGTAGSLQPNFIHVGDIINVTASVRDEATTADYFPVEVPAVASYELISFIIQSAKKLGIAEKVRSGIVHCKSSFYAREFGAGPLSDENKRYNDLLNSCGVLASEMETAALFIQTQLYNHQLRQKNNKSKNKVLAGALLAIIAVPPHHFAQEPETTATINNMITLALESIKSLSSSEQDIHTPASIEATEFI